MRWNWLHYVGLVVAGIVGGLIFTIGARMANDLSLLINSDVIGASIGAALTIGATLAIQHFSQRAQHQKRLQPLRKALVGLKGVGEAAIKPVNMDLPLAERCEQTATVLGALGGGIETVQFGRERAEILDVALWLKLETLNRAFQRQENVRSSDKTDVLRPGVTHDQWLAINERLIEFGENALPRINAAIEALDKFAP